jgi:hypothetical protein
MKKAFAFFIIAGMALMAISCKKVYTPQLVSVATNFLAVDGDIISGDTTFIRLSRTTKLSDTTQNKAELKAIVSVENDQKALYPLIEKGKGLYILGVTNFDKNRTYRLNIKTSDGKIYQSDFVPMKVTPAIDSIYIKQTQANEITFYADAHDGTNNTRYYRYDYTDTWSYNTFYHILYQYKNGQLAHVPPGSVNDISTCYRTSKSNILMIGSTAKLSQDVMKQQQLFSITNSSEKLAHTYVIQLRQYALTKEGFEYYERLKKNTEQIGSIFDPQPSALSGNIHCITTPSELVLGFISASTISNKQFTLFTKDNLIGAPEVNLNIVGIERYAYPPPFYEKCSSVPPDASGQGATWKFTLPGTPFLDDQPPSFYARANKSFGSSDSLLYDMEVKKGDATMHFNSINTYYYAPAVCVDCRLKGYTNIKPAYYP